MAYVITQPCCNDASCVAVCPVNCIHPTPDEPGYASAEMLYIDPDSCIDCGSCVAACPVDAVVADYEVTEKTERYLEINARYYADPANQGTSRFGQSTNTLLEVPPRPGPLRVAIVGSGPSAFYAAEALLLRKDVDAEVHMFERLPVPWGLARFGIAPDHQGTKAVTQLFARTATRRGLDIHLNVEVGKHITHEELLTHHHAVIYAVGALSDRKLGVPGEDLPGSHSATDFVAWYNGHPDFADRTFDLDVKRAVIVGNGNVALDVARILVSNVDDLARTDIADHALEALAASKIEEVVVLGRRGPAQAAFTTPELLGLIDASGFDVLVEAEEVEPDPRTDAVLRANPHAMTGLKVDVVRELATRPSTGADRRVVLRFSTSPVEILGDERVHGIRLARNEVVAADDGTLVARATGTAESIDCGLVLRSIGFRGEPLPGIPFDEARGTLPNDRGRVMQPSGEPLVGVYTSGWIKRGPSGVVGTNKKCAEETVQALLEDYVQGRLAAPAGGADDLRALISGRQPEAIDYAGWEAIDRHERASAKALGRPRIKLVTIDEMLRVVNRAKTDG
ncbi:FAD-dependent oxidoreductase [Nocardia pseudovaccinii]|uniref:FAD-dependent oxidoreductase n=1 Tax=Nocardia pseudovaccinii TaxID=189540 RepID=UPI003D8CCECB